MATGLINKTEVSSFISNQTSITLSVIGGLIVLVALIALFIPVYRHMIKNKPMKISEGVFTAYYVVLCLIIVIGLGIAIVGGNITKTPVTIRTYDVIDQHEVKIGTITATYDTEEKLIEVDADWLGGKENGNDVKEMKSFFENAQK